MASVSQRVMGESRRVRSFESVTSSLPVANAPFSESIISGLVAMLDILVVFASGLCIYVVYLGWSADSSSRYLVALTLTALVTVVTFFAVGLYKFPSVSYPFRPLRKLLTTASAIFMVLVLLTFAQKNSAEFSRVWAFTWFVCATSLACLNRVGWWLLLRRWARAGNLTRNIVVVGAGDQAKMLLERLDGGREPWNRIAGIFDDRVGRIEPAVGGHPVLGNLDDLLEFARTHRIDDVIVTLPWHADKRLFDITGKLMELPVSIHLGSDRAGFMYPRAGYSFIGGVPMLGVAFKPLAGWKIVAKALEDKVISGGLLILLSPLLCLIGLAIRFESKGRILFRQPRHGFNNSVISVFKFRTMYEHCAEDSKAPQAQQDDPRVTRVGRILRRTSLDELPQLVNVFQGTMSLVGPRPHPVPLNEAYAPIIDGYFARHRVKPGITGWAQVNGLRGKTETSDKMQARVEHDIHYIENWSLWFDLKILLMTAYAVLLQENAY